jgi:hypothetical protein
VRLGGDWNGCRARGRLLRVDRVPAPKTLGVRPFDFIILFFSFVYALALTHLLLSVTAMIRYRSKITFSASLIVWMFVALAFLVINWISLWDFHDLATISIWPIATLFVLNINVYLFCALISPEFKSDDDFNLRAFQERQRTAYLWAAASLVVVALFVNVAAGAGLGVQKWAQENGIVLAMIPAVGIPLFVKRQDVQIVAGLALIALSLVYLAVFYPALAPK